MQYLLIFVILTSSGATSGTAEFRRGTSCSAALRVMQEKLGDKLVYAECVMD
jgi:hypothetical protein